MPCLTRACGESGSSRSTTELQALWAGRRDAQGAYSIAEGFSAVGFFTLMPVTASQLRGIGLHSV